jgi:hypothetical protein
VVETEASKIVKEKFKRLVVIKEEALELFARDPYKQQMIGTKIEGVWHFAPPTTSPPPGPGSVTWQRTPSNTSTVFPSLTRNNCKYGRKTKKWCVSFLIPFIYIFVYLVMTNKTYESHYLKFISMTIDTSIQITSEPVLYTPLYIIIML